MEIFSSYTGADFLAFYALMLVTCVFLGLWIPANLRTKGKRAEVSEFEDIAVLSGGGERHATATLTDLFAQGGVEIESDMRMRVVRKELETGAAGRSLLKEIGGLKLGHVKATLQSHARAIEGSLIERGLLMDQGERLLLRIFSVLPYAALFVIGLYRQQAGSALGEPTGFLVVLLLLTAIFAAIRLFRFNNRTMGGNAALRDLEEQSSRLRRVPQANEAGYAVAIFGTGVLVGTPWEPVHAMRQAGTVGEGGSSSDGGDGGCGGGGCGGGGCGGCGG